MGAATAIIAAMCIATILSPSSDPPRKFILIAITVFMILTFACLLKVRISRLLVRDIKELRIITRDTQAKNIWRRKKKIREDICNFGKENQGVEMGEGR
jgi:hypothetical protein